MERKRVGGGGGIGDSIKKSHAFVIFIAAFSLSFFLRSLMNMDESVSVMALFL